MIDGIVGAVFVIYGYLLWWVRRAGRISRFNFRAAVVFFAMQIAVYLLYVVTRHSPSGFQRWLGDIAFGEFNLTATFDAVMISLISFVFLVVALYAPFEKRWHRIHAVFLFAAFLYLSADEYFMLHEQMGTWIPLYIVGGIVFALVNGAAFGFGYGRRYRGVLFGIFGGLAIMAAGGIALELVVERWECFDLIEDFQACRQLAAVEEVLENLGFGIVLIGALVFAEDKLPGQRRRLAAGLVALGAAAWAVVMAASFWIVPGIEAETVATPAVIHYPGRLTVLGYRTNAEYLYPGDTLQIDVYAYPETPPAANYGFSSHLLTEAELMSVAQADVFPVDPPMQARRPFHVTKTPLIITVPETITAPGMYPFTFTLWYQEADGSYVYLDALSTELSQSGPYSVILGQLPVRLRDASD